jgi:hypothetical protein
VLKFTRRFGGKHHLNLECCIICQTTNQPQSRLSYISILNREATYSSESSIGFQRTHIPEDRIVPYKAQFKERLRINTSTKPLASAIPLPHYQRVARGKHVRKAASHTTTSIICFQYSNFSLGSVNASLLSSINCVAVMYFMVTNQVCCREVPNRTTNYSQTR